MRDKNRHGSGALATLLFLASSVVFCGCQGSGPAVDGESTEAADEVAGIITAETLRHHVARISDDEMEGRSPGTEGTRLARQYLA